MQLQYYHVFVLQIKYTDAIDCKMLPKRRKLVQTPSADANGNSNHTIESMFARHHAHDHLQNLQLDNQHMISQTASLSEVTDRRRLKNRLSLSLRRKRGCTTDAVIDLTDDADNNNTADISEPFCRVFASPDKIPDVTTDVQNGSRCEASSLPSDSCRDVVSPAISTSVNQQRCTNVTVSDGDMRHLSQEMSSCQNSALVFVENSISIPTAEMQAAVDTEVTYHVPYYLENFLLALNSVFSDTFYAELFNDDDLSALHTFQSLSGNCSSDELFKI